MFSPHERMLTHLQLIYGEKLGRTTFERLSAMLEYFRFGHPELQISGNAVQFTERDAVLITYADQVRHPGKTPLQTLGDFLRRHLQDAVSTVHLLPFYPYSSDDGFSVIDYEAVDPEVGSWADVAALGTSYRLMLDAVINHISSKSDWFQKYLAGERPFDRFFIEVDPATDTSSVVRPRALPLLTEVRTKNGLRHVWTTFSEDQIDLNYANPDVMLEIIRILLLYVAQGAKIIRLDAIAYLWKEIGTSSIHLPETHAAVKLWRAVLDAVAPECLLITETNVPHEENISYFGDGRDEAQLVYQFPLAPLVLHTFAEADAGHLLRWAQGLSLPSRETTFFNFIASHDGIGVRPAEGILSPGEMNGLVERTLAHKGRVSFRNQPDGSRSVYELNITLYDFLNNPAQPDPETDPRRFLASQVIMLSLAGVPGIYFQSLLGARNCYECAAETGRFRSLNREKYVLASLEARLTDPQHHSGRVLKAFVHMLEIRRSHPAFNPGADQEVLFVHPKVFAVRRGRPGDDLLCLVNVSMEAVAIEGLPGGEKWVDLISSETVAGPDVKLSGYQARWLVRSRN